MVAWTFFPGTESSKRPQDQDVREKIKTLKYPEMRAVKICILILIFNLFLPFFTFLLLSWHDLNINETIGIRQPNRIYVWISRIEVEKVYLNSDLVGRRISYNNDVYSFFYSFLYIYILILNENSLLIHRANFEVFITHKKPFERFSHKTFAFVFDTPFPEYPTNFLEGSF